MKNKTAPVITFFTIIAILSLIFKAARINEDREYREIHKITYEESVLVYLKTTEDRNDYTYIYLKNGTEFRF